MKMYLRKHAHIKAMKRFGSEDSLKCEIEKRKRNQFEKALSKSEDIFSDVHTSKKSKDVDDDFSTINTDSTGKKKKVNKTKQKMMGLITVINGTV